MPSLGIYVHIPFCKSKCFYCDFCSSPRNDVTKSQYVSAIKNEISSPNALNLLSKYTVNSIFFGGGTPTCLSPQILSSILNEIIKHYSVSDDTEITLECNPGTVTFDDLINLNHIGFNRLSIGLQSTNDNELKALGRIHSFAEFDATFNNARKAGFANINLDLMYGIPLQNNSSFDNTLKNVIEYSPEHISAYSLKIEPGTPFHKKIDSLILPGEDEEYIMYVSAIKTLGAAGYKHYEISNYAKSGYESRHNMKYWNCDDYAGFGTSSHSCINSKRYYITNSIEQYLRYFSVPTTKCNDEIVTMEEELTNAEFFEEYIMMRLRLADGLNFNECINRFNISFNDKYFNRIKKYIDTGHVIFDPINQNINLSDEGMYISNYILSDVLDLS